MAPNSWRDHLSCGNPLAGGSSRQSWRPSLPALGLILGSLILAMGGGLPRHPVEETARMETVAYVLILDESGCLVTAAGEPPDGPLPVEGVLAGEEPLIRRLEANPFFEKAANSWRDRWSAGTPRGGAFR